MEFRDLKKQYQVLKPDIDRAISDVLEKNIFIAGSPVKNLERRLAAKTNRADCITCANGTDALELILRAWGIGAGDAVFVPDFTFFATAEPVRMIGAIPIFVDVREDTFNIDPRSLDEAIKGVKAYDKLRPAAVITVDLFGQTADYDAIPHVANKHDLLLFEDAAQAFGATYKGSTACSFGDAAFTSFFPAKPLGCYGDGGAIFINNTEKAEIIRSMVVHGKGEDKYDNVRIGRNSRLDTIQAAILDVKLNALEGWELADINKAAATYTEYINHIGLNVAAPIVPTGMVSSWAQYTIQLPETANRNEIIKGLADKGIPSMVYYKKPLSRQKAFADIAEEQPVLSPVAEKLSATVLSLPLHPYITESEIQNVCNRLGELL